MFTLIQTIAASLGYVNLSVKLKNQIYTLLAAVGNFYLLYVAYRFFANGFPVRGSLFILAFLAIAYFCYLNIFYYFTSKKAKFDVSPKIEKVLHLEGKDPLAEQPQVKANGGRGFIQTNGIFENEEFLPATLDISPVQSGNLQAVAKTLREIGFFTDDYAGLNDKQIFKQAQETGQEVPELPEPVALPYFAMSVNDQKLVIRGGVNQMRSVDVATVKTVGLLPAVEATQKFDLFLATAVLTGGPAKAAARQGVVEVEHPYSLDVRIAYRKKSSDSSQKAVKESKHESRSHANEDEHLSRAHKQE